MSRSRISLTAALSMLASLAGPAHDARAADVVMVWYGSRSAQAKNNWLYGDDTCKPGDRDCNMCAVTVREQFDDALREGKLSWKADEYDFNWDKHYEPSGLSGSDVFDDADTIQKHHIQSFVRTNHPTYPFAASHSDNDVGGIFFVHERASHQKKLFSIQAASNGHPSGMHALGSYVAVAEDESIRWFDVSRPEQPQETRFAVDRGEDSKLAGGGLGLAKLRGGGTLLLVAPNGGRNTTTSKFYYLHGDFTAPSRVSLLGHDRSSAWLEKLREEGPVSSDSWLITSENLSLVTECGTGDLYAIHATGDDDTIDNIGESGAIWRLSRVGWTQSGPALLPVSSARVTQNRGDCHLRSSGTVATDADGRLKFYCHQRAAAENLISDQETFHFKVGTPYGE
jgi:hypothetical protein